MISHLVYGLRLATNTAIPGLLLSDTVPEDVRIWLKDEAVCSRFSPLMQLPETPGTIGSDARVISTEKQIGFFYPDGARFALDRQASQIWGDWPEGYTLEDACTYLLGPVIGAALRLRGVTALHASAIAMDESAIALVGMPGAGKSTTAAAFALNGFQVISDDVLALKESEDGFLVEPGYRRLNLWPDSVRALFGAEDALPRITPTWNKRYVPIEDTFRFSSEPLILRAIYVLDARTTERTVPTIEAIEGSDALMSLVVNTYVNYLLDRDMRRHEFDVLIRLVARVPVRRVRPVADLGRTNHLCEVIAADAARVEIPQVKEAPVAARYG